MLLYKVLGHGAFAGISFHVRLRKLELCSESSIQYRCHMIMGSEVRNKGALDSGARLIHWVRLASALKLGTASNATIKKREYCFLVISVIVVTWCHRKSAPEFQKCVYPNWRKRGFWWLGHIGSHYK